MPQSEADLDIVTIGRSSVDLYGQQIGSRLEDIASFAKSVGGCPANIAIGAARLGLKPALVTRVGDEPMGRYIREQLQREGVAVDGVRTDRERLTALVLLSVQDDKTFPLIFYRENCADAALDESDIDPALIARARAICVTGTHFARPDADAAQRKAIRLAREAGRKVIFDIDYRPNLWGLAGHAAGEARYIRSDRVSAHLTSILPLCNLVVGTEEEVHIAAGEEDTLAALRAVRAVSAATIVLKRGPMGCVVFDGAIPDALDRGIVGGGFPIEVYNVLGAGDAFMAGFLRGWLRGEPLPTCATWANACGAFAVSRLLCSPESPTWEELQYFLRHGSPHRALRKDETINHIHWATTRRAAPADLRLLSIDHRPDHLGIADDPKAVARLPAFKLLAVEAAARVAAGRPGFGMFLDGEHGREALFRAAAKGLWLARQIPGSPALPPLDDLVEWPVTQTVKTMLSARPNAPDPEAQFAALATLRRATRKTGHELLVEVLPKAAGAAGVAEAAAMMARCYAMGVAPDRWLVEPEADAAGFRRLGDTIRGHDAHGRGFLVIARGLESGAAFRAARGEALAGGFVGGRAIFGGAFARWRAGGLDDDGAVAEMASGFATLCATWEGIS